MYDRQKITILPLHSAQHNLVADNEAFDLGFGVSVERCKDLLGSSDLWIWNHNRVQADEEEIDTWDTCLVHRYQSEPVTGERDVASITLLAYVLAHLRIINPHRDSVDDNIQLQQESPGSAYSGFQCSKAALRLNRFLCDCENLVSGISRIHLNELKTCPGSQISPQTGKSITRFGSLCFFLKKVTSPVTTCERFISSG
jgi:hypothetical protein